MTSGPNEIVRDRKKDRDRPG